MNPLKIFSRAARQPLRDPLWDIHYERYRRLEGLFNALPDSVKTAKENQNLIAEFKSLRDHLENLIGENRDFTQNDAPDYVHNLHLLLLQLLPMPLLIANLHAIRDDFREEVGEEAYKSYCASEAQQKENLGGKKMEEIVRAEAIFLTNQVRSQTLLKQHVENTRARLIRAAFRSWRKVIVWLVPIAMLFLVCQLLADGDLDKWSLRHWLRAESGGAAKGPNPLDSPLLHFLGATALLSLAGIAGATGGMVSMIQRIQQVTQSAEVTRNLQQLSQAETAVMFAPVTGMIFALIMSITFAGGLVSGSLFPEVTQNASWYAALWSPGELAKWLVWAFLAGFSERLVPNILDRFASRASDAVKNAPVSPPVTSPQRLEEAARIAAEEPKLQAFEPVEGLAAGADMLRLTGSGFAHESVVTINGAPKDASTVEVVNGSEVRVKLAPEDTREKTRLIAAITNPNGKSSRIEIPIQPLALNGDFGG